MAWNKKTDAKNIIENLLMASVAISSCALLFACGGDSSNSSKATVNDDGREVGTLAEMGRCTIEREGDTVYVAEKLTDYLCQNNTWIDLSEISDGNNPPDVMPGSSSAMSVSSSATSENSESVASSSSLNKEAYSGDSLVVKNRSILGVAQKGPFMFGSPVYLRELTEDSLKYTGMVYEDEISSNKGDFVIPNVSLLSPYACVEVHGQYRNEITGEYSKDSISLFALTDLKTALSDEKNEPRNKVNVNLLTHLEYSRALYLVRKGYSVYAAKKQADQEIMTAFELPTTVKYSEDLSVFEDSQDDNVNYANASLMVLSLLFLGERNDAEIQAAVDSFIVDFETDGVWDDAETKTAMADYATEIDTSKIRANVKAWNILDIPKFENPLETFWNNVYGLGGCSDKRLNVVAPNNNKLSKNYNKYFICNGGHWVDATTYQKDTYGWSAGKSGEFKKGNVTDTIYVFNGSNWEVSKRETSIGLCGKNNAGVVSKYDGIYYICKNSAWESASMLEYDTYGLTGVEGDVKAGVVNKNRYYVYENGSWRVAANDQEVALGVCSAAREGVVAENDGTYYICKSKVWKTAAALEYDTYGWKAGSEGEVKAGNVNEGNYYTYRSGQWQKATNIESDLGGCVTGREGDVGKSGSSYYICRSNAWTIASSIEADLGGCVVNREGEVGKSGSIYYICKLKTWTIATVLEYDTYGWNVGIEGEVKVGCVNTDNYYIYKNGKWQAATNVEKILGGCTTIREGVVAKDGDTYYICKSKDWEIATVLEYDTYDKICLTDGTIVDGEVDALNKYVCDAKKFRKAENLEISLDKGCVSYTEGNEVRKQLSSTRDSVYLCRDGLWNAFIEFVGEYGSLTDSRDGKIYKTVVIENHTWMAENLNYSDSTTYWGMRGRSWCYINSVDSCSKYGRLYSWAAAMDSAGTFSNKGLNCGYERGCSPKYHVRGICPEGWHLPSIAEWEALAVAVDNIYSLQAKGYENWPKATDSYGFTALPASFASYGTFGYIGTGAQFWSSTPEDRYVALRFGLYANNAALTGKEKTTGLSVRCLKDFN